MVDDEWMNRRFPKTRSALVSHHATHTRHGMTTAEPILPWGQLGVSELSLTYDEDLGRYLMVTLPAFSNKVRPPTRPGPVLSQARRRIGCIASPCVDHHDRPCNLTYNRCSCGRRRR